MDFGSKDSLNDTGIPTGNVAAYRKSLESKCVESGAQIVATRKSIETKSTSEIRKSLENLDDRKNEKTPPPVLSKKPIVPMKKSPTVGSVAGNIFSGLKQKVKSVEQKMTHHDSLDGVGGSKIVVADNNEKGVSGERLRRGDSEFDDVERNSSLLQDMRAERAKGPKRRLPTSNSSSLGESLSYQNGDSMPVPSSPTAAHNNDGNKSDEDIMKPKPREWEKNRAPWMDELKASQAKKTSPGIELRSPDTTTIKQESHEEKSFGNSYSSSHKKTNESSSFEVRSSSVDVKSSANDSTFHSNSMKKETNENSMTKSLSSLATKISISESSTASVNIDDVGLPPPSSNNIGVKVPPTSVTLRNVNPLSRLSKTFDNGGIVQTSTATITSKNIQESDAANHGSTTTVLSTTVTSDNVCSRVVELELRVQKLEKLVQKQNATIEELLKSIKDESDKVKTLKHELDKYAQCVTQV